MKFSEVQINLKSPMRDLLKVYPWAQRALFRGYHIGGCSQCAFDLEETFSTLCERNELDPAEVLEHIKKSHDADSALHISPIELNMMMKKGRPVRLLDIRSKEEWDAVRLPNATRMSQESMAHILSEWKKEGLMVIYDHLGKRSLDAATYFQGQGFTNVRCLIGGIDQWSKEVDPKIRRYRLES